MAQKGRAGRREEEEKGARYPLGERESSVAIEDVYPVVDCGRFPAKRTVGDVLEVRADIFVSGRKSLRASVKYAMRGSGRWAEAPMTLADNDRWSGKVPLEAVGTLEFFIEAWPDEFTTLLESLEKWSASGEDISVDLVDLQRMVESAAENAPAPERGELLAILPTARAPLRSPRDLLQAARGGRVVELVNRYSPDIASTVSRRYHVVVDRESAEYAAWYEMFHRSQGHDPTRSGTFRDAELRLREVKQMGFDVVYLPPVHPIGRTNRRGRNNAGEARPEEPGSPWAIGSEAGGHYSINPELGTMEDFEHFVAVARETGLEVAIDLALQASPDHPYVREHPEWFFHRSDGTIRYAENPPKRYFDIYPLRFEDGRASGLWDEALRVVLFWVRKGIKTFRVDNPHTKPMEFWEWLIQRVKGEHPDVLFLAEAFTRPKVMKRLAKLGFSESYTYFTWKNTQAELVEFLTSFVTSDAAEYYRGNFFTNTPDILSRYLQLGGRPAFKVRLVLAATLSSLYGIYNGFELSENRAVSEKSEEYLDSEKYQYKVWDWDRPGNIKDYITRVNRIRRENRALHRTRNLRLLRSTNENIFFFGKWTQERENAILVAVNLDPWHFHDAFVTVPVEELGLGVSEPYLVVDLLVDKQYEWRGATNYVGLDPSIEPAHIFLVKRQARA